MVAALVFLTPLGALVALAVLVPLGALVVAADRERSARVALRLPAPPPVRRLSRVLAVAAVPLLLGAAAAQPALRRTSTVRVRTDAQVFVVLDNSRSMSAAPAPGAPTRLARAKAAAIAFRNALPDVPAGVATLTDRVLPQLFPNASASVFADTVQHAVSIEAPPPTSSNVVATSLAALGALGTQDFFPPSARKRVAVVFTDGESRPFDAQQAARALATGPGVKLVLVHVWRSGETVFDGRQPEGGYHADPASAQTLSALASAAGGKAVDGVGPAVAAARAALGKGPTAPEGTAETTTTLGPYVALAALVPLLLLVARSALELARRAAARAPAWTTRSGGARRRRRTPRPA